MSTEESFEVREKGAIRCQCHKFYFVYLPSFHTTTPAMYVASCFSKIIHKGPLESKERNDKTIDEMIA